MNIWYRLDTGIIFETGSDVKFDFFTMERILLDERTQTVQATLRMWPSEAEAEANDPRYWERTVEFDKEGIETVAEAWAFVLTLDDCETLSGDMISLTGATVVI